LELSASQGLFKAGIWLKGINGGLELIGGILLATLPSSVFTRTILFLTQHDVGDGTKDWVYRELSRAVSTLAGQSTFAVFYLLSHGLVKVFLAGALLRGIGWAYPTALGVFGLLAGYEVYRFVAHPAVMMGLIIAIEVAVIVLIWSHWRAESGKRNPRARHSKKRRSHATA